MQKIAGVFDRLSSGAEAQELVLITTAAFSYFRLLPRLPIFRQLHPNLSLRLKTQMFTGDLRYNEVAIRYGDGNWGDGTSTLLFDEEVFPVCSPAWLEANGVPGSLAELAEATLVEDDSTSEGWLTWEGWFQALGARPVSLNYALRACLYSDAIQAAIRGQGVALGWSRLIGDYLASGELVRLGGASLKVRDSYFAVVPHGRTITPAIQALIELLRDELPPEP